MDSVIRTGHRHQISKDLSYPVGAEAVSAALRGVPQFASLSISFWPGMQARPAEFHESAARGDYLRTVEVTRVCQS